MINEEQVRERYDLTIERIRGMVSEETVPMPYRTFFQETSCFILKTHDVLKRVYEKPIELCTLEELQDENRQNYEDILGENYETSYANPSYAVQEMGEEIGRLLSFLYTEIRGEIAYAYEKEC